jgi:hypothetical protein
VATPKPKPESQLDEEDYVDLKRTQITLKLRMERRRLLNEVYQDVLEKKERGKLLSAKPVLEAQAVDIEDFGPFSEAEDV